jgi:hypothetical protein
MKVIVNVLKKTQEFDYNIEIFFYCSTFKSLGLWLSNLIIKTYFNLRLQLKAYN